jgi:dipeptidase D
MDKVFEGLTPELLWKHFDEIRKIPRCSGSEEKIIDYIVNFAKERKLEYKVDEVGNVVIKKKATNGKEGKPGVILQGHIDMVCEKNNDIQHDFTKDPIKVIREGDWFTADGTTLGADNGIGVAAALAVLDDDSLVHGPVEALFTIDEERGLTGAANISSDFISGRILLNLDSEDDGVFTIGCAGGGDSLFKIEFEKINPENNKTIKINVSGFKGGHSGIDINNGRGNAIKVLTRVLFDIREKHNFELALIEGGDKRNAIPREAYAIIVIDSKEEASIKEIIAKVNKEVKEELKGTDDGVKIDIIETDKIDKVVNNTIRDKIIDTILALPHGVLAMSQAIEGLVESSTNLAAVHTNNDYFEIVKSSRSSINSMLNFILNSLKSFAQLIDASIEQPPPYPGWTPDPSSPLLQTMKEIYKNLFGKEPIIEAIHAGLETGIIGEKIPGMDMISFGPTIKHPHSPDEKVEISTVDRFWTLLTKTLEHLAS